jgi:hypothetical protein
MAHGFDECPEGARAASLRYISSAMKRTLIALLSTSSVALLLGACDTGGSWGYGGYSGGGGETSCSAYTSCDTCTPVSGCGWCTAPSGSGVCSPDPDDCPTEQFSWTWNPSGCRVVADASVGVSDGGATADRATPRDDVSVQAEASSDGSSSKESGDCLRDGQADAPTCD